MLAYGRCGEYIHLAGPILQRKTSYYLLQVRRNFRYHHKERRMFDLLVLKLDFAFYFLSF